MDRMSGSMTPTVRGGLGTVLATAAIHWPTPVTKLASGIHIDAGYSERPQYWRNGEPSVPSRVCLDTNCIVDWRPYGAECQTTFRTETRITGLQRSASEPYSELSSTTQANLASCCWLNDSRKRRSERALRSIRTAAATSGRRCQSTTSSESIVNHPRGANKYPIRNRFVTAKRRHPRRARGVQRREISKCRNYRTQTPEAVVGLAR